MIYLQRLPQVLSCQCALNLIPLGAASLQPISPPQWESLWVLVIYLHCHILCNSYLFSLSLCNLLVLFPLREKNQVFINCEYAPVICHPLVCSKPLIVIPPH